MRNYLLSFLMLSLIFAGCKKTGRDVKIDSALKEAFNFKKGTYWIYKDSLTNEIDSFYVTYYTEGITSNAARNPKDEIRTESVVFEVQQKSIPPKHGDTIVHFWKYFLQENRVTISYYDKNKGATRIYGDIILDYPYRASNAVAILPSYNAAGTTFTNVALINSYQATKYDDYMYLSSGAGFLKMSMRHQKEVSSNSEYSYRVLELQRYSIVK